MTEENQRRYKTGTGYLNGDGSPRIEDCGLTFFESYTDLRILGRLSFFREHVMRCMWNNCVCRRNQESLAERGLDG